MDSMILLPRSSETIDLFSASFVAAQAEFPLIGKNKKGGGGRYTYADITEALMEIKPILKKHNLSVLQPPAVVLDGHRLIIATRLLHASGQWLESYYPVISPVEQELRGGMTSIQAQGSNVSYSKRYALMAMLGLATTDEDTDGEYAAPVAATLPGCISQKQANLLSYKLKDKPELRDKILEHYKIKEFTQLPREHMDTILEKIS